MYDPVTRLHHDEVPGLDRLPCDPTRLVPRRIWGVAEIQRLREMQQGIRSPIDGEPIEPGNFRRMMMRGHPLTCGNRHWDDGLGSEHILEPTPYGWVCPVEGCEYRQGWIYDVPPVSEATP